MARALLRFVTPDAMLWVHDYHFLPLAKELRALGLRNRLGLFLHTPFPTADVFASVPFHRELVQGLLSYDVVGFQTDEDRDNFADYLRSELGLYCLNGMVATPARLTRLATFPIGIDAERFARRAIVAAASPAVARLRSSLQGGQLAIGVDRLDYSKGLTNRFLAFDRMINTNPELRRAVSLLQIAVPSRERIGAYRRLQSELATLLGSINGRHSDFDWVPIRYLNRGFAQSVLAGLYRTARVGLVTPHRDGMNLVAKEYVAAQNPHDPGALVLSRYAGAAKQLDAALLIDPCDVEAMARTVADAFAMPLGERRDRWQSMMAAICRAPLAGWSADFIKALRTDVQAPALPATASTHRPPPIRASTGPDVRKAS
jgi:trehalose 6-phosphate synthase